tara:strand:+ start:971 stop:1642 length:672 start_codon:yes stop_codon:yes gene_type:complete
MIVTALVPMKGNSERIPNKNLKKFNKFPLYHSIIKSLIKSKRVDKIVVNTDSSKIRNDIIANFSDVHIIERPKNLLGDDVSMNKIIEYDLSVINSDLFIQTHSTNPLLSSTTIDNSISFFINNINKYDSLLSVNKFQSRFYSSEGIPINHSPNELMKTQDLDPIYEENSNFYIFSKKTFFKNMNRIGDNPFFYECDRVESIDIDYLSDFTTAQALSKIFKKND